MNGTTHLLTANPLTACLPSLDTKMGELYSSLASLPDHPTPEERAKEKVFRQLKLHTIERVYIPTARDLRSALSVYRAIFAGYEMRPPSAGYWSAHHATCHSLPRLRPPSGSAAAPAMAIMGVSGAGKSTSIENILGRIPQVIEHTGEGSELLPRQQIAWIKVTCPVNRTPRAFIAEFFDCVDRIAGTCYSKTFRNRLNDDELIIAMAKVARAHFLGLLVIDEIQNAVGRTFESERRLLKLFVNMTGTLRIPILFVGTPKCQRVLNFELADARRMLGPHWTPFAKDDPDWNLILDKLWEYQWTKSVTTLTNELRGKFYELTQGVPALAKALFSLSQSRLILNSTKDTPEIITPSLLEQTYASEMMAVHEAVHALKTKTNLDLLEDLLPTPETSDEKSTDDERISKTARDEFETAYLKRARKAGREKADSEFRG